LVAVDAAREVEVDLHNVVDMLGVDRMVAGTGWPDAVAGKVAVREPVMGSFSASLPYRR